MTEPARGWALANCKRRGGRTARCKTPKLCSARVDILGEAPCLRALLPFRCSRVGRICQHAYNESSTEYFRAAPPYPY